MDPNDAAAYNTQGLSYRDIGQYEQAIELNPDSYRNRFFCYYNLGQDQRATEDFDKVIELNPERIYYCYGIRCLLRLQFSE